MEGIILLLALAVIFIIIVRRLPAVNDELDKLASSSDTNGSGNRLNTFSSLEGMNSSKKVRTVKRRGGKKIRSKKKTEEAHSGGEERATALDRLAHVDTLIQEKSYDEAERILIDAVETDPANAKIYNKLGIIYLEKQNFVDAKEAFKTALKYDKNNDLIYNNLGLALFDQGRYAEAIEAYQESIRLNSIIPHRYINLGLSYASLRQYDKALEAYRKALVLDKNNKDYKKLIKEAKDKIEELKGIE